MSATLVVFYDLIEFQVRQVLWVTDPEDVEWESLSHKVGRGRDDLGSVWLQRNSLQLAFMGGD